MRRARRFAFLAHRWLGIALALLMVVWAASGVVMMYVAFPETGEDERLAGLEPIAPWACCDAVALPSDPRILSARIEMMAGVPVLRWEGSLGGGMMALDRMDAAVIDAAAAARVAGTHLRRTTGLDLEPRVERIGFDQWTVYGRYRAHRPLYRASFDDPAGTILYVSGSDGTLVQDTTRRERFWNWLGAVPHWLYFTALRQHQALWYDVVVCVSLLGVLLALTGLYAGWRQLGRGGRFSPYRGLGRWHHRTGLVFGLFTLTWVLSGLFSMQPFGLFESRGPDREQAAMAGREATAEDLRQFVAALAAGPGRGVVSARLSMQDGRLWAILARSDGSVVRAALPGLAEQPPTPAELADRARRIRSAAPIASMGLIHAGDAYYYGHKREVPLPVFRVIYGDDRALRLYIDPRSGELAAYVDAAARGYRWWFNGLHRMDFFPALRQRPVWDMVTLPLLLGVGALASIGLCLAIARLRGRRPPRSGRDTPGGWGGAERGAGTLQPVISKSPSPSGRT